MYSNLKFFKLFSIQSQISYKSDLLGQILESSSSIDIAVNLQRKIETDQENIRMRDTRSGVSLFHQFKILEAIHRGLQPI